MDAPDITGPLRWLRIALPLALTLAIGGLATSAVNAYPVGYALFGLAGIMAGAASAPAGTQEPHRDLPSPDPGQQQADLDRVFRSGTW